MSTIDTFSFPAASDSAGMPWPCGLYEVTLIDIKKDDRPSQFLREDGTAPERTVWTFQVDRVVRLTPPMAVDVEIKKKLTTEVREKARQSLAAGHVLRGWCSVSMHRKSVMRGWVEALMGKTLRDGEVPELGAVIGRKALATVATVTSDNGKSRDKLTDLAPLDSEEDADALPF